LPAAHRRGSGGARGAVLYSADVQHRAVEVDLVPAQIVADLSRSEAVPVGQQDRARVTMPVTVAAGALDQRLDLVGVKCSRVRKSAFFCRFGVTVRFTSVGVTNLRCDFAMGNRGPRVMTVRSS
jgi:hypothetical protein